MSHTLYYAGGSHGEGARFTVKSAMLMEGDHSTEIIVASVFDQKPFYMITNAAAEVTRVEVSKKVWRDKLSKHVALEFLQFCISHCYNYQMKNNDIAGQLRWQYIMMRFGRNFKRWWALWLWGFDATIVNAYMMYCGYH